MTKLLRSTSIHTTLVVCGIVIGTGALLTLMGRIPWCTCGVGLWTSSAWSSETSQMLADPYSFSHVLHGILFFWLLRWIWPRFSLRRLLVIALLIEVGWELFENSPFIIERYRANTASLDYFGDSVLNSLGDLFSEMIGFWLAWKLRWRWALLLFIAVELLMLALYRDNLTLNVLMIVWPLGAIKEWQIAGHALS